jgi:uncharacterized protein (TIGR03083 family)
MPTQLTLAEHLDALGRSGAFLREAAARAGLGAKVPTCPEWDVAQLVIHQGMVHRWAAANLRGDQHHDPQAAEAEGAAAPDLLSWYSDGLEALLETLRTTSDDAEAMVFLKDAPAPRRFWARRQTHETTIHSVDALAADLGRWPSSSDVSIDPAVAADGIDELLCGFITRSKGKLRAAEPYRIHVRSTDTRHTWTVRVSDEPVVTAVGASDQPDAVFSGSAVQLYLSLWNRADEITADGRPDVLDQWRSQVQVRWS